MARSVLLPTLRHYRPAWLGADLLAGVTLVAIALPEQMATARLAGMPAVTGCYAFVAASALFALLGRDRYLSVGADSTIAPLLATAVGSIAVLGTARAERLSELLAVMVGVVLLAVGAARLGWVADFLSVPVVTGVLAGIATSIVVRELPPLLGVEGGGSSTIGRLRAVARELPHASVTTLAVGCGALLVVVGAERIDRRMPGALLALVGSGLAVGAGGLRAHGVAVLGSVRGGLPALALPGGSWTDVRHLLVPALTVAFVCVAQSAATLRERGTAPPASEFDGDLLALGAASVGAGFLGSFAVDASPPRTEVARLAGARSQLAALVAAGAVLLVLPFAHRLGAQLPLASLAAILLFVASRLFRLREFAAIARFDRVELALALLAGLVVALAGIEEGVVVAMLLALAERTRRTARPRDAVLAREPGSEHWIPSDVGRPTEVVPGIVVYLVYAPLWYGNADYVVARVRSAVESAPQPVHALVLDADAMSDVDFTGARKLGELAGALAAEGVTTGIARSSHLVHRDLKHSGLLAAIGPDHLYASVEEAVDALGKPAP